LKTLRENEFFDVMIIEEKRYWKCMLFMDYFNSAGVEEESGKILANWSIAEFFPKIIENMVYKNVNDFIE